MAEKRDSPLRMAMGIVIVIIIVVPASLGLTYGMILLGGWAQDTFPGHWYAPLLALWAVAISIKLLNWYVGAETPPWKRGPD